jgi:hypothetical protein
MKKIHPKYLPAKAPVSLTLSTITFMEYFGLPEWLRGIWYFILFLSWVFFLIEIQDEERPDNIKDLLK